MNKTICKYWLLALLVPLVPSVASAVGLGKLTVLSLLGQPLNAEIELVSVQNEELSTLSARLAALDLYQQSNRQYSAMVTGLRFQIEKRPSGQPYIKLTSDRAVDEPFVDLLLEVNWASGRLVREYTLLIDPPNYALTPLPRSAPVAAAQAPAVAQPPVAMAMPSYSTSAGEVEYGPVKRGETLSKIAARVKPQGVSLAQMLIGIFRNNPDAFISNNMNRLKVDKMLRIPDRGQLIAMSQPDAVKEVRVQVTERSKYQRKAATTTRDKNKTDDGKPILRLSSGTASGGASERSAADRVQSLEKELIAREQILNDSNQRIKELKGVAK